jgi:murein L,D-transpeptidase YafK
LLGEKGIDPAGELKIVIDKSDHTLSLFYRNTWLKTYHVELGEGGPGDKVRQGDKKTPEGTFYITEKKSYSPPDYFIGSRWMMLSYPNKEAADRGLWSGLIDQLTRDGIVAALSNGTTPLQYTPLGGRIGIHGGDRPELGNNWTYGCVGLTNSDVEDFYDYVAIGTPVIIRQ